MPIIRKNRNSKAAPKPDKEHVPTVSREAPEEILKEAPASVLASMRSGEVTYTQYEREDHRRSIEQDRGERFDEISRVAAYENAVRTNSVMRGPIAGVEIINRVAHWVIYDDPVIVRIPFEEAFIEPPKNLLEHPENITDRRNMMEESIDYLCPFIPLSSEKAGDSIIVYASRIQAVWRDRVRYFGTRPLYPTREGDVVDGIVMSVKEKSVRLYVRGYEVQLERGELTHKYIDSVRKHYFPGDAVKVKVMSLHDPVTGAFSPKFDAKEVERDEFRKRLAKRPPSPGMTVTGIVVTMREMKNRHNMPIVRATIWLENQKLPCFADLNTITRIDDAPIKDGSRVKIRLSDRPIATAFDGYLCRGTIVSILRSPG